MRLLLDTRVLLLVAQVEIEQLTLVTADKLLNAYGTPILGT